MITVRADPENQQLIFTINQKITEADFLDILARLDIEIPKLKTGWIARIDLRGLIMVDPSLNQYIMEIQKKIFAGGSRKIGTLLDSFVLQAQINRSGKQVDAAYYARRFDDKVAWEKYLSEPEISIPDKSGTPE
jgi:hypothetical protein